VAVAVAAVVETAAKEGHSQTNAPQPDRC